MTSYTLIFKESTDISHQIILPLNVMELYPNMVLLNYANDLSDDKYMIDCSNGLTLDEFKCINSWLVNNNPLLSLDNESLNILERYGFINQSWSFFTNKLSYLVDDRTTRLKQFEYSGPMELRQNALIHRPNGMWN